MIEAEWRADRQHPLAYLQLAGIAQLDGRQPLALDLQHRHIGTRIGTDELGLELAAIGQAHDDLVRIGDHVIVGQDVAIFREDEARAQRLRLALLVTITRHARDAAFEKLTKDGGQSFQVGHMRPSATGRQLLLGTDIDDRGRGAFHQRGEVRQLCLRYCDMAHEQHHRCQNEIVLPMEHNNPSPMTKRRKLQHACRPCQHGAQHNRLQRGIARRPLAALAHEEPRNQKATQRRQDDERLGQRQLSG